MGFNSGFKGLNHAESVLTFQGICKSEIEYANTTVIQWACFGVMLNTIYSVNPRLSGQCCITVIA